MNQRNTPLQKNWINAQIYILFFVIVLMPKEKGHVKQLEAKVRELQDIFEDFGDAKADLDTFWKVIHRPGWTTVAEILLVNAALEAEKNYAQATLALNRAVLSAASKVELNPQPLPP